MPTDPAPPRFDMLGPPNRTERVKEWFTANIFVDREWSRMVFASFVSTLVSLIAQIVIKRDVTPSILFLNTGWIRWSATFTLLSATWLVTSSTANQANQDEKRDFLLWLVSLWGLTLAVSMGVEIVLGGPEKDVSFKYWFVGVLSFVLLVVDYAVCVKIRKSIFKRVLGI